MKATESSLAKRQREGRASSVSEESDSRQLVELRKRNSELESALLEYEKRLAANTREIALLTVELLNYRKQNNSLKGFEGLGESENIGYLNSRAKSSKKILSKFFFSKTKKIKQQQKEISILRKTPLFDNQWYVNKYPDVKASNMDAVEHYVKFGAREGRNPGPNFDTRKYLEKHPELEKTGVNPLVHHFICKTDY